MKSNKQRRVELDRKKKVRVAEALALHREKTSAEREAELQSAIRVNASALAPYNSYSGPEFVARGYYVDKEFECVDCAQPQVWTASQQKWWYEVAKGCVWSTAIRCRECRRRRRLRGASANRAE